MTYAADAETFSVCQILEGGICEWVRLGVDAKEAVEAAHHYTHNVAAKLGFVECVLIVDGDDFCCFEWKKGEGVTYPEVMRGRR